jgi:hypothetical protein
MAALGSGVSLQRKQVKLSLLIRRAIIAYASLSSSCPSCFFGPTAAIFHSFPYTVVETLTGTIYPLVTEYPNGTAVTTYSTFIEPYYGSITASVVTTFSDINHMSWTVSGVAL